MDNACVICSPGYVRPDPSEIFGTYGTGCKACEALTYSTDGLTCQACPAGTKSTLGSSECYVECDASQLTYKNTADECACKAGFGFNSAGGCSSFDSATCPAGQTLCVACPADYFSSEFTKVRDARAGDRQPVCLFVSPFCSNRIYPFSQTGTCMSCDSVISNSVNKKLGSITFADCVCSDSYVIKDLADGARECACPAGKYEDGSTCVTCEEGKYKENAGNEACASCGLGKTTGGRRGETSSENCLCAYSFEDDGQGNCVCALGYGITTSATGCEVCTAGKYSDELSLGACRECPKGTWGQSLGSER